MSEEAGGAARAELVQARLLMETAMSPLASRVETVLQSELEALNSLPRVASRKRIKARSRMSAAAIAR